MIFPPLSETIKNQIISALGAGFWSAVICELETMGIYRHDQIAYPHHVVTAEKNVLENYVMSQSDYHDYHRNYRREHNMTSLRAGRAARYRANWYRRDMESRDDTRFIPAQQAHAHLERDAPWVYDQRSRTWTVINDESEPMTQLYCIQFTRRHEFFNPILPDHRVPGAVPVPPFSMTANQLCSDLLEAFRMINAQGVHPYSRQRLEGELSVWPQNVQDSNGEESPTQYAQRRIAYWQNHVREMQELRERASERTTPVSFNTFATEYTSPPSQWIIQEDDDDDDDED